MKNTDEFKACLDTGWTTVSVRGKDGVATNGKDGITTVQTTTTTVNKDTVVNGNMWYDPISLKYWLIPSTEQSPSSALMVQGCGDSTSNYRLPNLVELQAAVSRGLQNAADTISAPREAWAIKDPAITLSATWVDLGDGNYLSEQYVRSSNVLDNKAGYYCIQK